MCNLKRSTADLMLEEYLSFLLVDGDDIGALNKEFELNKEETERVNRYKQKETPERAQGQVKGKHANNRQPNIIPNINEIPIKEVISTKDVIQTKADQLILDEMALWAEEDTEETRVPIEASTYRPQQQTINPFELELKPYAEPEVKLAQVQQLLKTYATQELTETIRIKTKPIVTTNTTVATAVAPETQVEKLQKLVALATTPERKEKLALYQQGLLKKEQPVLSTMTQSVATAEIVEPKLMLKNDWKNVDYGEQFQVLYFLINGVKFAAPLIELGMIQLLDKLHHAVWRPKWCLGLMMNTQEGDVIKNIEVIDSAQWAMPQRLMDGHIHRKNYRYVMRLNQSRWGLALDDLIGSSTVRSDQVNWRVTAGKRPWLAGIIRDQMCVLLHIDAMIQMFEQGLNVLDVEQN